jgi:hypothetical protein
MAKRCKYHRKLDDYTRDIVRLIHVIDAEMKKPSDNARGKRMAAILNRLELGNDSVMRYTLGLSFLQIENRKNRVQREPA